MGAQAISSAIHAKILAGRILSISAGKASASLNQFSGWLLSGFGAALALLLANIDAVFGYLNLAAVQVGIWLFLSALIAGVLARYLGAIVIAGAAAATEAAALGKELGEADVDVDASVMFREAERATFWPARAIVASSFRKVESGDFAAGGRLHSKLAQVQALLVVGQAMLLIGSAVALARGLAV